VPLYLVHPDFRGAKLQSGILADIAPTLCKAMGLPQPREMDRRSLLS